jgi:hypothetical protein
MKIDISPSWRIHARGSVDVPLSATAVWGQMRDIAEFLCIDPLHSRVLAPPGLSGAMLLGSSIIIQHRFLGIGVDRIGRVLRIDDGHGFVVSDLSIRGTRVGFPHVCIYRLEPLTPDRSRIHITARGKWTATWLPRLFIKAWLWWILRSTESMLAAHFAFFARRWAPPGKAAPLSHPQALLTPIPPQPMSGPE